MLRRHHLIPYVFLLGFLTLIVPLKTDATETRAILDERFSWLTPREADETLKRIKEAGFNVFIPCVWHGRGVTWNSEIPYREPRWEKNYRPGHDPLQYLIKKAHSLGIEVHPWFTVTLRQRNFYPEYADDGTPQKAFNVHKPEFQKFIVKLVAEVVRNYDVDGINLDYIRSIGICTSDYCATDYSKKMKRNLKKDLENTDPNGKLLDTARSSIGDWNATAIDSIVYSVSQEIKKIKPNVLISVDSYAGNDALKLQGTDSIKWANEKWIDLIYHMDYKPLAKINSPQLTRALKELSDPKSLILMVGNYDAFHGTYYVTGRSTTWPREANEVVKLIQFARQLVPGRPSYAVYAYSFLSDDQISEISSYLKHH